MVLLTVSNERPPVREAQHDRCTNLYPAHRAAMQELERWAGTWRAEASQRPPGSSTSGISLCYWLGTASSQYDSTSDGFADCTSAHVVQMGGLAPVELCYSVMTIEPISTFHHFLCHPEMHAYCMVKTTCFSFFALPTCRSPLSRCLKCKWLCPTAGRVRDHPARGEAL